ncbi:MAG: hypothetical protein AAFR55_00115 [Pseudomonadota bacterium]
MVHSEAHGRRRSKRATACVAAAIGIIALAVPPPARADDEARWMPPDALRATFSGVAITGFDRKGIRFSARFARGGDAVLAKQNGAFFEGAWSIVGRAFCTIYDSPPAGACYVVRRVSANCFGFHHAADTRAAAAADLTPREQTALEVSIKGQQQTCVRGERL